MSEIGIAIDILAACCASVFGWHLRGWYERRMNPRVEDTPTYRKREDNVYYLKGKTLE